jgi:hypothetical protein
MSRGYIASPDGTRLTGEIEVDVSDGYGWGGTAYVPVNEFNLRLGGSYKLHLTDGRVADILIARMPHGSGQATIRCVFEGSGPPPARPKGAA